MKNRLFIFLLLVGQVAFAQRGDGIFKIEVEVEGKLTTLYTESYALLIGNSGYTNVSRLPGVKTDILDVKRALEEHGFKVIVKENLTKDLMDKAFTEFITTYGQGINNRLLFYYAGHGHTESTTYGDTIAYLVPIDVPKPDVNKAEFCAKSMPMSRIEEYAKQVQSKHALFVFDACFAGSIFSADREISSAITHFTTQQVRQFITSGSAFEKVPDKSIFRQLFVEAITSTIADGNKDGYLTGTELSMYLETNVINLTRNAQHPQYGKIRNINLKRGDFVFVIKAAKKNGFLKITSGFQGELYIDSKKIGFVLKDIELTEEVNSGYHTIEIKSLEKESMNKIWKQTIQLAENETKTIDAKDNFVTEIKTEEDKRDINKPDPKKNTDLPTNFVLVKGGTFTMGSTDGDSDEQPTHEVTVSDFYMGKYEVTQKQWREVMGTTVTPNFKNCDDCPMESVSWYDAVEFCNKLSEKEKKEKYYTINGTNVSINSGANGYRLPTEAEWEYAAGGGQLPESLKLVCLF